MTTPATTPATPSTTTPATPKRGRPPARRSGVLSTAIGSLPDALDAALSAERSGVGLRDAAVSLLSELESASDRLRSLIAFK